MGSSIFVILLLQDNIKFDWRKWGSTLVLVYSFQCALCEIHKLRDTNTQLEMNTTLYSITRFQVKNNSY